MATYTTILWAMLAARPELQYTYEIKQKQNIVQKAGSKSSTLSEIKIQPIYWKTTEAYRETKRLQTGGNKAKKGEKNHNYVSRVTITNIEDEIVEREK